MRVCERYQWANTYDNTDFVIEIGFDQVMFRVELKFLPPWSCDRRCVFQTV